MKVKQLLVSHFKQQRNIAQRAAPQALEAGPQFLEKEAQDWTEWDPRSRSRSRSKTKDWTEQKPRSRSKIWDSRTFLLTILV